MDNKKIVAVSVLAVLALAFAGYGYASYTASTYNSDNNIATQYVTITPDSWAAMTGDDAKFDMDTWTYQDGQSPATIWRFSADSDAEELTDVPDSITVTDGEVWGVEVGSELGMTVGTDATDATSFDLTVEVNDAPTLEDGYYVLLKITEGSTESYIDISNPEAVQVSGDFTVQLVFVVVYDTLMEAFPTDSGDNGYGCGAAPEDGLILEDTDFIFRLTPSA